MMTLPLMMVGVAGSSWFSTPSFSDATDEAMDRKFGRRSGFNYCGTSRRWDDWSRRRTRSGSSPRMLCSRLRREHARAAAGYGNYGWYRNGPMSSGLRWEPQRPSSRGRSVIPWSEMRRQQEMYRQQQEQTRQIRWRHEEEMEQRQPYETFWRRSRFRQSQPPFMTRRDSQFAMNRQQERLPFRKPREESMQGAPGYAFVVALTQWPDHRYKPENIQMAQEVVSELRQMGWCVDMHTNLQLTELDYHLENFSGKIKALQKPALFYIFSHGCMIGRERYFQCQHYYVSQQHIMNYFKHAPMKILVFNTCANQIGYGPHMISPRAEPGSQTNLYTLNTEPGKLHASWSNNTGTYTGMFSGAISAWRENITLESFGDVVRRRQYRSDREFHQKCRVVARMHPGKELGRAVGKFYNCSPSMRNFRFNLRGNHYG